MTEQLGTLTNLNTLYLRNCSLTYLPDLSGISYLWYVDLSENQLSKVDGLTTVYNLYLDNNLFTELPTLNIPSNLNVLTMSNNPLKNMLAITSHVNLYYLYLKNTTLSYIPPTIDRLQKLESLDLSDNKLFYLPTNMLNLVNLKRLNIQNNLFSSDDIKTFQAQFNRSQPTLSLIS